MRIDGRAPDALRPVTITPNYLRYAEGSAMISYGNTKVLCAASVEDEVPQWLRGQGRGWVTAQYGMLPRSTETRHPRPIHGLSGRTQEIRRFIGRALRASLDLSALGERLIIVDCDVIQADGGTRTASVTGGFVALALALRDLVDDGLVDEGVFVSPVAAVSAGVVDGEALLDLCYEEDARAAVDFNVVMNADDQLVEVQGTAEGSPFSRSRLQELLDLAEGGTAQLLAAQKNIWT
ncbi:MAG: ribonuclease PH [Chloroflexota bacterium]|nr:ribonuclease PH [Chloroflexota bacterium]